MGEIILQTMASRSDELRAARDAELKKLTQKLDENYEKLKSAQQAAKDAIERNDLPAYQQAKEAERNARAELEKYGERYKYIFA